MALELARTNHAAVELSYSDDNLIHSHHPQHARVPLKYPQDFEDGE